MKNLRVRYTEVGLTFRVQGAGYSSVTNCEADCWICQHIDTLVWVLMLSPCAA